MAKKKVKRTKHIPQRTCVGCRSVTSKRELIRLVRTSEGIVLDTTLKMPGRGVYLHENRTCWEHGLQGAISRGLKIDLSNEDRAFLIKHMEMLPSDPITSENQNR